MTEDSRPTFMSRQEAAVVLGVGLPVVNRLISTGVLDRYRIRNRYVRVRAQQVRELADMPREWLYRC